MGGKKDLIVKVFGSDKYAIEYNSIEEFLRLKNIKVVPSYQRPYSWEIEQVNQLIEDIERTMISDKEWFIGPIFTSYNDHRDDQRDILDGQQRLTTIILLLRSIYIVEHLITTEKWNSPRFPVEYSHGEDESVSHQEIQRTKQLKRYEVVKSLIEECLVEKSENEDMTEVVFISKFHTSIATRASLNEFIASMMRINNHASCLDMEYLRFDESNQFYPTLKTINRNIEAINDFLKTILIDELGETKVNGLTRLNDFALTLLRKITFLEIPLNKSADVLDIFESINNRGKKLTLSDLIRFRTIKKCNSNDDKRDEIEKKWNEIFKYSSELSDKNGSNFFFKSLDVFLQRFINSISSEAGGYTEDADRLAAFDNYYERQGSSLETGVDDILRVLKSWSYIFSDGFRLSPSWGHNNNVSSLVNLFRMTLNYSEQSQICFIGYLRSRFQEDRNMQEATPRDILQLIQSTICISIFNNVPANAARNFYILIAKSFENYSKNPFWYDNFGKDDTPFDVAKVKANQTMINATIFTKDNKRADIILSYYHMLTGGKIPSTSDYQRGSQIDHIMPQKWFSNKGWKELNSKEELENSIYNLADSVYKEVLLELNTNDDFYSTTKWANSFVQLIGNKVHMFGPTNLGKSNNYWLPHSSNRGKTLIKRGVREFLRDELTGRSSRNAIVPEKPIAITDYEEFKIGTIIDRSVAITRTVIEDFEKFPLRVK